MECGENCINAGNRKAREAEVFMTGHLRKTGRSHIPHNSLFFEKFVPALLILMTIITVGLVLFAVGVLLGLIRF